ncbi:MAG: hypothetical protein ACRYF6_23425 [Janthinobacterium lividum]
MGAQTAVALDHIRPPTAHVTAKHAQSAESVHRQKAWQCRRYLPPGRNVSGVDLRGRVMQGAKEQCVVAPLVPQAWIAFHFHQLFFMTESGFDSHNQAGEGIRKTGVRLACGIRDTGD